VSVNDGPWLVGVAKLGEDAAALKFNSAFASAHPDLSSAVFLQVGIQDPTDWGMHTPEEGNFLNTLPEHFERLSGGVMVGSVTTQGHKDFLIYCADDRWVAKHRDHLQAMVAPRTVEVRSRHDPDWELYLSLLGPSRRAHADLQVYKALEDAGAIMHQPRRVDWRFRFVAEHSARQAETVLLGHDYQVAVVPPGEGDHWAVTASLTAIVNLPYVVDMNAMMDTFANDQHGLFDGWGASVQPSITTP
jgi:hypothetical protein